MLKGSIASVYIDRSRLLFQHKVYSEINKVLRGWVLLTKDKNLNMELKLNTLVQWRLLLLRNVRKLAGRHSHVIVQKKGAQANQNISRN